MLRLLICSIKRHSFEKAGSCPFTGKTYQACIRCNKMIEVNNE
jgi:hypothetical protein